MNKKEFLQQILFRREAEELAEMSPQAFQKHISKGHIAPAKEYGTGKGKTQMFWKEDAENLRIGKYKEEIKVKYLKEAVKEAIQKGAYVVIYKDKDGYNAEPVAENGRDSFRRYNEVIEEYDFTDHIISDGINTIEEYHPDYDMHLDATAEYEIGEMDFTTI